MHAVDQKDRHDRILRYINNSLDRERFRTFVDIKGFQTESGGTIPNDVLKTDLTPGNDKTNTLIAIETIFFLDVVIVDDHRKSLIAFELTVPLEWSVWSSNQRKLDYYESLNSNHQLDTSYEICVKPFEVTSITGILSRENKNAVRKMHKFCNPEISLATFRSEISAIAAQEYRRIMKHWLLQ